MREAGLTPRDPLPSVTAVRFQDRILIPSKRTNAMASVVEHYASHLAPIYVWMAGGFDSAVAPRRTED
jgi:hypothetical protein